MYLLKGDQDGGDWALYWWAGGDEIKQTLALVKAQCENGAVARKISPESCVPVAVNDQQVLDPTGFYRDYDEAVQQERDDLNTSLQLMQMSR